MNTARLTALFALFGVFASGAVVGVVVDRVWLGPPPHGPHGPHDDHGPPFDHGPPDDRGPPPDHGPPGEDRLADRLTHELDLDATQAMQVKQILVEGRQAADQVMAASRPQLDAAFHDAQAKIRALLRADQQHKYDAWLAHGPRGFGPPGPPPPPRDHDDGMPPPPPPDRRPDGPPPPR